jgi:hypothetical protein
MLEDLRKLGVESWWEGQGTLEEISSGSRDSHWAVALMMMMMMMMTLCG